MHQWWAHIFKYLNILTHKYNFNSYLWLFLDTNIFRYSFGPFLGIQIYSDICLDAFHVQFYNMLNNLVVFWHVLVMTHKFEWLIIPLKFAAYIICIHIRGFSSVRIYLDIHAVNSWASEYIRIFVWSTLGHPNLLGYLFKPISWSSLITVMHSKLVHRERTNKNLNKKIS